MTLICSWHKPSTKTASTNTKNTLEADETINQDNADGDVEAFDSYNDIYDDVYEDVVPAEDGGGEYEEDDEYMVDYD